MNPAEAEKKQGKILKKFSNSKRLKLSFALSELTNKLSLLQKKGTVSGKEK